MKLKRISISIKDLKKQSETECLFFYMSICKSGNGSGDNPRPAPGVKISIFKKRVLGGWLQYSPWTN